eukprot:6197866-Alexandrium_andersonii.AAC.1
MQSRARRISECVLCAVCFFVAPFLPASISAGGFGVSANNGAGFTHRCRSGASFSPCSAVYRIA